MTEDEANSRLAAVFGVQWDSIVMSEGLDAGAPRGRISELATRMRQGLTQEQLDGLEEAWATLNGN